MYPITENIKPPREAYSFWPVDSYILSGSGTKSQRLIFAKQQFTEFELKKLGRLEEAIIKDKISVPAHWGRDELLRFCYGTSWKTRNAIKALKTYLVNTEHLPKDIWDLYPKIQHFLVMST